ncbi:phasin family protein [Oceanobacillus halotolerans]|uniref:phasin family protein n=1 Tax=Oceanobacillus halotolerans TaxID=2663380 RepID=UPI0013DB33A3|nr:polyhydroxyalkanoate synthesis regulator [Oceanobacillus halotolerans]
MRSTIRKGLALGLGLAVTSKEQAQKVVDELVERGELSKQESKEFFNELLEKGKETQKQVDEKIQHKLNQLLDEANLATKEEVDALKERVEELEKQLEQTK